MRDATSCVLLIFTLQLYIFLKVSVIKSLIYPMNSVYSNINHSFKQQGNSQIEPNGENGKILMFR